MSDRITRKDLRTDGFAVAVENNVDYVSENRAQIIKYAIIGVAVAVLIAGGLYYRSYQHTIRQEKLAEAIQIQEAPVTPGALPGPLSFATDQQKHDASDKAFSTVASEYSGSREGLIASYYLACIAADAGKMDDARKRFQTVADSSDKPYAALAKLALSDVAYSEGKDAEGEKLLKDLIDNPTVLVSKEQATIALARHWAATKPAEARKLVEPLTKNPGAISQLAVQIMGELQNQ